MKPRLVGFSAALMLHGATPFAGAAVIYHGLQNIAIPANFDGVYLNIDNGVASSAEFAGWDINPFFGGFAVGSSPAFQPARTGSGNSAPLLALGAGATVNGSLLYSAGHGGSETHLGAGANRFGLGQEAYLGFRFTTDGNAGPYYGWMRVVFTANIPGGVIKDWAYETGGTAIQTANVLQTAPQSGISAVTLSGGAGQNSTLGSVIANVGVGNAIGIVKTGAGTWNLSGPQSYATIDSSGGTLNLSTSRTLNSLNIGAGAVVALGAAGPALAAETGSPVQTVPEPGGIALLFGGLMVLLARPRR